MRLKPIERRQHRRKDPREQDRDFLDGMKIEIVGEMDFPAGGEIRTGGRGDHDEFAQKRGVINEYRAEDGSEEYDIAQALETSILRARFHVRARREARGGS